MSGANIMNKNKYIIISVDFLEQGRFFLRWQKAFNKLGYSIIFISYTYSVYAFLKKYVTNYNLVDLICNDKNNNNYHIISEDKVRLSIEYNAKWNSIKELKKVYYAILEKYNTEYNRLNVKYIVLWNGNKMADISWKDIAINSDIKTIYVEIANIEGKIFVDPLGTNAKSYLYKNVKILKRFDYDEDKYCAWKNTYINEKYEQTTVRQAKKNSILEAIKGNLLDIYGILLYKAVYRKHLSKKRLWDRMYSCSFEYNQIGDGIKYIFFPLQVSTDTQVLINGNMTLLDSIEYAVNKAKDEGCWLVIKPHPAEKNPANIKEIKRISTEYDKCIFSDDNTFKLLKNAHKVITINSTVGLESLILGCDVDIIGKAFYKFFENDDLQRYIMGYLVNVDYWGHDDLTIYQAQEILSRADIDEEKYPLTYTDYNLVCDNNGE
ncbi:capsular polysaccharide export protein, LipB/KpsS family [Selenomonas ruminantium]|uniref:Capsular polysaccharide export protein n=1 Tax=Selenomonas ruminantium TaxID=971 RepID=A0A1H0VAT9_SELRU|nr:hypothetical protein [Selenomonas ruminantium]SDP75328.1 capsular polysaccharide export protein [Selenomonas ruminantium]